MSDPAAKPAKAAEGEKKKSHPADPIFDRYDKDKNGTLDKKEVEAALADVAKAQGKKKPNGMLVKAAIKVMDKDKSGTIDREEFRTLVDKLIEQGVKGAVGKDKKKKKM
mmetsp:Transcript_28732/g.80311  ORF Transcript_28732/g.80311 Transcript_28732/m.80311 type:complete len:109 (-) Transcript_28732:64-390(-)|eukprot:CAMPEP_0119121758 /NCGR_PEP_ID=MMETSP1310-20130426/2240_1 /TAXON_ID=464262 /ORGANISM="Genus nov. species nov., Strain RCC2339" /LENGTH=108 /DNA_ID=CAMNT_0007111335 /DNA_START=75 /DNA_END=401 /DNA_ORIENTATION=-